MIDWLPTIIGGLSSLGENIVNWFSRKSTNESNEKINEKNLDFQAAQTQAQWERDDTAHQREVADLKAAGLSPLANTSGANTSQALGAPSPIAMEAPQVDVNSLINSVIQNKALNETERHNRVQEGQKYTELHQQAQELENKVKELSIKDKDVENQFLYQSRYIQHLSDQLDEVERSNMAQEELKRLSIRSEEYFKSIQSQTGGNHNYKIYNNYDEYSAALQDWTNQFESFIDEFLAETSASSSSSNSSSYNGSAGVNGQVLGSGIGANGTIGSSESSSGSHSYNVSQRQQAEIEKWYRGHPMPVFIYHYEK